jgi:hypothetical protein
MRQRGQGGGGSGGSEEGVLLVVVVKRRRRCREKDDCGEKALAVMKVVMRMQWRWW